MDVDYIVPSSSILGWHSLQVKGEIQTRKGLWWIPRHLEMRKGVVSDEMLWGVENKLRGEIPLEPIASWFSPKCVEAQQLTGHLGVKYCFGAGRESDMRAARAIPNRGKR
ncbi:hypothetical protein Ahy_B08g089938 [Arachis hypogaea]|uniref:Uncharacterized protein n=1 Tax=Arachis hypogaea TaxID=3818 RepID=A0A444XZ51_ARAHY|nr:hypothetical protein Ahy_B08g089938 [Arachis hypogaea]